MSLAARPHLTAMARYHAWATERLLAAVETVAEDAYRAERGLFFGSIHGTLNHLLLTDAMMWQRRLEGQPIATAALDAEVVADRGELAAQLAACAARWEALVEGLDDAALDGDLAYTMSTGQPRVLPMALALLHVFNHGTHHRGQVTAALSSLGHDYPPLDMPLMVFAEQAASG